MEFLKICSICGVEKSLDFFSKRENGKLRTNCRICEAIRQKKYYLAHRDKLLKYRFEYCQKNHEQVLSNYREYYQTHKEKFLLYRKKNQDKISKYNKAYGAIYRRMHPDTIRERDKNYLANNRARIQEYRTRYNRERYLFDINFKLMINLRHRLYLALKGDFKSGSAVNDLGCSILTLKQYLTSKFQPGMTWENYGKEWHIDHVIPLSFFDLQNETEFKMAVRYQNLQPLWAKDNLIKHNRLL